ncbi:uncharacterized protein LOC126603108 [Malus sylvestris]|uniref:uncharacterized protein LOC126603108 n=1 Tax=Malus sylvestris TaxID=3752 RepID=UPI0021ACD017|nr:uncharacterized protein LOC126603108 [Malus sylvestris]
MHEKEHSILTQHWNVTYFLEHQEINLSQDKQAFFLLLLFCSFSFFLLSVSLSALSHSSLISLLDRERTHAPIPCARKTASSPSRPSPPLSRAATPGNPERNSGEFLFSRTKSKPGVSTPNSGDLGGFSGHLRPFHDKRKVNLMTAVPLFLFGMALHQRCTDIESRHTIPASRHFRIGIFESSWCGTHSFIHSILYYFF